MLGEDRMVGAAAKDVQHDDEAAGEEGAGVATAQHQTAAQQVIQVVAQDKVIDPLEAVGGDGEGLAGQHALNGAKFTV